jgi:signal peptidase II
MPSKPAVTRLALYAYGLAAVVAVLDQWSKAWILYGLNLAERGQIPVLPFFRLTFVMNIGVSYNLLRAETALGRYLLVAAATAVVAVLAWWVRKADRPLFASAIGLIIGGAIGNNLVDRVRLGWVIDILDFSQLGFPWVFNLADSAISVGVALLLLDSFMPAKPTSAEAAEAQPKDNPA